MKRIKIGIAVLLGTLAARIERLTRPRGSVALANALGLFGMKAETLYLDPNSSYGAGAWPLTNSERSAFLVQRGASGYQYGDLSGGVNRPLGVTFDAPYNTGDAFEVHILGAHPGLFMGVGVAGKTITTDNLVVAAAGGKIQDITTITANGAYWVVGKAAMTIPATGTTMECSFVPCLPYQVTVSNNGGTYAYTAPTGS